MFLSLLLFSNVNDRIKALIDTTINVITLDAHKPITIAIYTARVLDCSKTLMIV